MPELRIGNKAPDFELSGGDGKKYSLRQFFGKKIVLYFYPQDDTETCTLQACSFRDHLTPKRISGAVLIGVSPDSPESHKKFSAKYGLNFPLLSDEDKTVMKAYGVWKRKVMFGKKYMGVIRSTFIINERGFISHIFSRVRLKGHVEKIQEAVST